MKIGNQNLDVRNFWRERFKTNGHTGWGSRKIYLFDQWCRLQRLVDYLEDNKIRPGKALDFGCGSGDFSRLLIERGWEVVAYDPFVLPKVTHPRLLAVQEVGAIEELGPYDFVISVTALDHCLEDDEFLERLSGIGRSLKKSGTFFFIEYASDLPREKSTYQSFRTLDRWIKVMQGTDLQIRNVIPYFHPKEAPIAAWNRFKGLFSVWALLRLSRVFAFAENEIQNLAKQCLENIPYRAPDVSPIKIIIGIKEG